MNILFILGLTFILIHEMDAIRCHEWQIFPGLSLLSDRSGMTIFILAHIPIIFWIFNEFDTLMNNEGSLRIGFDIFLIFHLVLHILFLKHAKNEFKDWISWTFIIGAAAFGAIDLSITEFISWFTQ